MRAEARGRRRTRTGWCASASISSSPRLLPYAHSSTSSSPSSARSRVAFSGPAAVPAAQTARCSARARRRRGWCTARARRRAPRATSSRYTSSDAETITTSWPSRRCQAMRSRASGVIADRASAAPNARPAAATSSYGLPAEDARQHAFLRRVAIAAPGAPRARAARDSARESRASTGAAPGDRDEERHAACRAASSCRRSRRRRTFAASLRRRSSDGQAPEHRGRARAAAPTMT